MATWREMQEHPERITEEEKKAVIDSFRHIKKLGEAFDFKMPISDITPQLVASNFYQEHLIIAAIFEAFIEHEEITLNEINQYLYNRLPKDFVDSLTIKLLHSIMAKTIRLGYIDLLDKEDRGMQSFGITEDGIAVLKNQTFQSLAATSFFGKQTFDFNEQTNGFNKEVAEFNRQTTVFNKQVAKFNKRGSKMNVMMLIITALMAVMTAVSIWVSICK